MNPELQQIILRHTGARTIAGFDSVQSLWSGYGEILQVELTGAERPGVMVKQVRMPEYAVHPRGWHTEAGHQRKMASYRVEWHWYQQYARQCSSSCKVPDFIYAQQDDQYRLLIMEDLSYDFPVVLEEAGLAQIQTVLRWLANFHARFMFAAGDGLWPIGSYWHLETRAEEFERMPDQALKMAAQQIHECLSNAHFQTLIHGDAKLANFCFNDTGDNVAAVDFQYVGRGCGMKDVVYLFTCALDAGQAQRNESALLDFYFQELHRALTTHGVMLDFAALELEWRSLYPFAWADFQRFLDGWSPEHWKINAHMKATTDRVLSLLV